MEIIVQGNGKEYFAPDEIILNIKFNIIGNSYKEALIKGTDMVEQFVNLILLKNGFSKEDMKTKNFIIREQYRYDNLTQKDIFEGFLYEQRAHVKFDYDKDKLSYMMVEISNLDNAPQCQIKFGLKNENQCRKIVLSKAYQEAFDKAGVIAESANKTLKNCIKVDCKSFDRNYISNASLDSSLFYNEESNIEYSKSISNTFTPEDIEITEVLYCLWIAE